MGQHSTLLASRVLLQRWRQPTSAKSEAEASKASAIRLKFMVMLRVRVPPIDLILRAISEK